jgi:hypothetical protein
MSKSDDMRAMREARYEASKSRAATPDAAVVTTRPVEPRAVEAAPVAAADPVRGQDDLCGHRAISGRTCTREKGHSAKSHRYG